MPNNFYLGINRITEVIPVEGEELVAVPQGVIDGSPMRLCNMPVDEIVYASQYAVVRDEKTSILMVDTMSYAEEVPTTEAALMLYPPVMRVVRPIGGVALDGFLVDYRRIAFQTFRDSRLEYGTDNTLFEDLRAERGTVFPLGALFNLGDKITYHGRPELVDAATDMMRRVDTFVRARASSIKRYKYTLDRLSPEEPKELGAAQPSQSKSTEIVLYRGIQPPASESSGEETDSES